MTDRIKGLAGEYAAALRKESHLRLELLKASRDPSRHVELPVIKREQKEAVSDVERKLDALAAAYRSGAQA